MSLYRQFQTDEKIEQDGVTLDYGDSGKIRIARAGGANKAYQKAMEKIHRRYRHQLKLDILPNDVAQEALVEAFADSVVLGWEDVTDKDDKPLPYSKENCVRLFLDLPDLFRDVREQAENAALFRAHLRATDAKN